MKGAVVDLATGELAHERIKISTPAPGDPERHRRNRLGLVTHSGWDGPVGLTLPSVVVNGIARTAANIDKSWIDTDTHAVLAGAWAAVRSRCSTTPMRRDSPRTATARPGVSTAW